MNLNFPDRLSESNIANWQQTIVAMDAHDAENKTTPVVHADTFSVVFARPVEYERPTIESFGHKLGGYQFYSLGTRGAVFVFYDAVQAPMIEIWFPPPGYYDQISRAKNPSPSKELRTIVWMGLRNSGGGHLTQAGVSDGFIGEESFNDGTVAVEFNPAVDPATLKVRREHSPDELTIVERQPHKVRFKIEPPELNGVVVIIIEAART
jgi:hypothetical protein